MYTILVLLLVYFSLFAFYKYIITVKHPNVKNINNVEARDLLSNNPNILILDVRTEVECNKNKLNIGLNIPEYQLKRRIDEIIDYKDSPILICCENGKMSPFAVRTLLSSGFTNIYHLKRGISSCKYTLKKK